MTSIRDPLWNTIVLDDVARRLIDTPVFQRLRYVRQVGLAHLVSGVGELTGEWVELPTCAVVECRVNVDHWAELVEGTGELVSVATPKD